MIMKNANSRVLGVIGGMGPLATQLFYKMVIENTDASCDQEHIDMIILSHASMPDRTLAIEEGRTDELVEKLGADARFLEESGASCIAVPCNTTHVVLPKVQEKIGIPIINMIEETAKEAEAHGVTRVGILATDGTMETGLYHAACEAHGIEAVSPPPEVQEHVMHIIYGSVKSGEPVDMEDIRAIEQWKAEVGCERCILGCTELPLVREYFSEPEKYIDAMLILARRSVEKCGAPLTGR